MRISDKNDAKRNPFLMVAHCSIYWWLPSSISHSWAYSSLSVSHLLFQHFKTPMVLLVTIFVFYIVIGFLDAVGLSIFSNALLFPFWTLLLTLATWMFVRFTGHGGEIGMCIDNAAQGVADQVNTGFLFPFEAFLIPLSGYPAPSFEPTRHIRDIHKELRGSDQGLKRNKEETLEEGGTRTANAC